MGPKSPENQLFSLREYIEIDNKSEEKYEYLGGRLIAMAGASVNHSRINRNFLAALNAVLSDRKDPFEAFGSDIRIYIPGIDAVVHPDLAVVCGKPEMGDEEGELLINPGLIMEVLSKTTSGYDRGEKFYKYRKISAFREYILVDQYHRRVDVFSKTSDGNWLMRTFENPQESFHIETVDISLSLEEVYRKVDSPGKIIHSAGEMGRRWYKKSLAYNRPAPKILHPSGVLCG